MEFIEWTENGILRFLWDKNETLEISDLSESKKIQWMLKFFSVVCSARSGVPVVMSAGVWNS